MSAKKKTYSARYVIGFEVTVAATSKRQAERLIDLATGGKFDRIIPIKHAQESVLFKRDDSTRSRLQRVTAPDEIRKRKLQAIDQPTRAERLELTALYKDKDLWPISRTDPDGDLYSLNRYVNGLSGTPCQLFDSWEEAEDTARRITTLMETLKRQEALREKSDVEVQRRVQQ